MCQGTLGYENSINFIANILVLTIVAQDNKEFAAKAHFLHRKMEV